MKEFRFVSKHSILADTEDEAREMLMAQSREFTDNAVVSHVIDFPTVSPSDRFRFDKWGAGINGCLGTIRTVPENYFVASVYPSGYLVFDGIEPNTRYINEDAVREWWAQKLGERKLRKAF